MVPDAGDTPTDALGSSADTDIRTVPEGAGMAADHITGRAGHGSAMTPRKRGNWIEGCDTPTDTVAPDGLLPSIRPTSL